MCVRQRETVRDRDRDRERQNGRKGHRELAPEIFSLFSLFSKVLRVNTTTNT